MHNNGTTPQILLPDKRLLPDLAPPASAQVHVTAAGVVLDVTLGTGHIPLCMPPDQAIQLGVLLISAAAVLQKAAHDAAQVKQPSIG